MDYFFNKYFNEYEVKPLHLSQLPIKWIGPNDQEEFSKKAEKVLVQNFELQKKTCNFKSYLQSTYAVEKLPKPFDKLYELDFSDIQKALKKLKINLSKKDEFELMELFEYQKRQALEIKSKIDQTDREIDQMVYELYGLTEEEIKIVEEATQ